jgi:hypothetical protein
VCRCAPSSDRASRTAGPPGMTCMPAFD